MFRSFRQFLHANSEQYLHIAYCDPSSEFFPIQNYISFDPEVMQLEILPLNISEMLQCAT